MLSRFKLALSFAVIAIVVAACNVDSLLNILFSPQPQQFAGAFETLAVDNYANPTLDLNDPYSVANQLDPIGDTDNFAHELKTNSVTPWSQIARLTDSQVSATSFQQYQQSVDALFYDGHGGPGVNALYGWGVSGYGYDEQAWGAGDTLAMVDGDTINGIGGNQGTGERFPAGGRLKWIFDLGSDTVAAPPFVDPNDPYWTADWTPAFGGSLHGLYGAWQDVGSCPFGNPSRTCDVANGTTAKAFGAYVMPGALSGNPLEGEDIHDAWVSAFIASGQDGRWAIWEDASARNDIISGPGNGSAPPSYTSSLSGSIIFYYPANPNGYNVQSVTVAPDTFALNPQSIANESWNAQSLAQQYEPQAVSPVVNSDNGSTYVSKTNWGGVQYNYGQSGAVMYFGPKPRDAMAFSQSTALQAAETYVSSTLGMPSDAVLYSVLQFWTYSPSTGAAVNDGYEFIWHHANSSVAGYDAIKVVVADRHTSVRTCVDWIYNDPPIKPICDQWQVTTSDTPYISSAFRLWRSLAGTNSNIQPAGMTSIDAVTAASALPAGANITAYQPGLWMPGADASSSEGARSAWIFTIGGREQIAVDAYTGQILGSTTEQ
ncbi:MAG TPA: hypothetical protein VMV82_04795 [Candidatus Dormibacteraeota bacterium]|nr:hypothetical protein [Candidatus Dormibacteraeota bacterium]